MEWGFEWDEGKRQMNMIKHGFDFLDAEEMFDDYFISEQDNRFDYGEIRCQGLGMIRGREMVVVYTKRNQRIRLISLRKANAKEIAKYRLQKKSYGLGSD